MQFPTYKELGEKVAKEALDTFEYNGKTLREWIEIISAAELGTNLAEVGTDLISRQAAIDFIDAGHLVNPNEPRWSDNEVVNFLKSRPSAQPEIIRCKDCKHSRFFDPCFYCYEMGGEIIVPENGFCFKAERREDG